MMLIKKMADNYSHFLTLLGFIQESNNDPLGMVVSQGSPMTSSDAEMDFKPIIVIIIIKRDSHICSSSSGYMEKLVKTKVHLRGCAINRRPERWPWMKKP